MGGEAYRLELREATQNGRRACRHIGCRISFLQQPLLDCLQRFRNTSAHGGSFGKRFLSDSQVVSYRIAELDVLCLDCDAAWDIDIL